MKGLFSIDLEATGTDPVCDRIIQIGIVAHDGPCFSTLINPGVPLKPVITELTGITDAMLAEAPAFADVADAVLAALGDSDLVGFNLWQFDLPLLSEELGRCGLEFDWRCRNIIDAGVIFKKKEERTLSAAVEFYCGRKHVGAHGALADATATQDVLSGQLAKYSDLAQLSREELAKFSVFEPRVDLAGKLSRNAEGEVVYNFGRNTKGVRVVDDPGFAQWILDRDFPRDTKAVLAQILDEMRDDAVREKNEEEAEGGGFF
jgi:DNA polymerase-3 subunit epsilon